VAEILLGKREDATGITTIPLAQSVVPTFLVIASSAAFGGRAILLAQSANKH